MTYKGKKVTCYEQERITKCQCERNKKSKQDMEDYQIKFLVFFCAYSSYDLKAFFPQWLQKRINHTYILLRHA